MHEKANTSANAYSLEARNRVCTRKPKQSFECIRVNAQEGNHFMLRAFARTRTHVCIGMQSFKLRAFARGEETCMHEKANTSLTHFHFHKGNVFAWQVPIHQFKCIRSSEETCMHEKANTSLNVHVPEAKKRVCMKKPTHLLRRMR